MSMVNSVTILVQELYKNKTKLYDKMWDKILISIYSENEKENKNCKDVDFSYSALR